MIARGFARGFYLGKGITVLASISMVARTRALGVMTVVLLQVASLSPARGQERRASVWVTSAIVRLLTRQTDVPFAPDTASTNLTIDVTGDQTFQQIDGFGASLTESSAWLMATALTDGERATLMTQSPSYRRDRPQRSASAHRGVGLCALSLLLRRHAGRAERSGASIFLDRARPHLRHSGAEACAPAQPRPPDHGDSVERAGLDEDPGIDDPGELKRENYGPYAAYFVKLLQAYAAEGIPIETITVQNEPHFTPEDYPGMYMASTDQATFVRDYLAPAFAQATSRPILAFDHNWNEPNYPLEVFSDVSARAAFAGSAFHCYAGDPSAMTPVHAAYPDKSLHVTECSLFQSTTPTFAHSLTWATQALLIGSLRNWAQTVVTWNLALDPQHGPHLGGCLDCTASPPSTAATAA